MHGAIILIVCLPFLYININKDLTDTNSLVYALYWIDELLQKCNFKVRMIIAGTFAVFLCLILQGTKLDLVNERKINKQDAVVYG